MKEFQKWRSRIDEMTVDEQDALLADELQIGPQALPFLKPRMRELALMEAAEYRWGSSIRTNHRGKDAAYI